MLCRTEMVCLRVEDPHLIFERIYVLIIQTHMNCLLTADLSLPLNQLLSLCTIPLLPPLLTGGDM